MLLDLTFWLFLFGEQQSSRKNVCSYATRSPLDFIACKWTICLFFSWIDSPSGQRPQYRGFTITLSQTHRTWQNSSGRVISPKQRRLPITHNNHKRQTSMLPSGFEPPIQVSERLEAHALDGAATGIGQLYLYLG